MSRSNNNTLLCVLSCCAIIILWTVLGAAFAVDNRQPSPITEDELPVEDTVTLYLNPVEGITAGRYVAPERIVLPVGRVITLEQKYTRRGRTDWEGATELQAGDFSSMAEVRLDAAGRYVVRATTTANGLRRRPTVLVIDAVKEPVGYFNPIAVELRTPLLQRVDQMSNAETMELFFGESIAAIDRMPTGRARGLKGAGTREIAHFVTSIDRALVFEATVRPVALTALTEWRIDGAPTALGTSLRTSFETVGRHEITVGPVDAELCVIVDVYETQITSHVSNVDRIAEGKWVTFEAMTNPPGYEDHITWLASTKFGRSSPIWGRGPTFTVRFDDTWGEEDGAPFQWLGVKADNVIFNQDQKCPPDCPVTAGNTFLATSTALQFIVIPAGTFGPNTDAFAGEVTFIGSPVLPGTDADTVMHLDSAIGLNQTTTTQLTQFHNISTAPITITGSGPGAGSYDVDVSLSPTAPSTGELTITSISGSGGTYDAFIQLYPLFEFRPVGGGEPIIVDTGNPPMPGFPLWLGSSDGKFTLIPPPNAYQDVTSSSFYYAGTISIVRTDVGAGQYLCVKDTATNLVEGEK